MIMMQIGLVIILKGMVKGTNTEATSQSPENMEKVAIKERLYTFEDLLSSNLDKYESSNPG